jgi:hypothetical protein
MFGLRGFFITFVLALFSYQNVHAHISLIIANLLLNNSSSSSAFLEPNLLQNQTKSNKFTLGPDEKFGQSHHFSRPISGKRRQLINIHLQWR